MARSHCFRLVMMLLITLPMPPLAFAAEQISERWKLTPADNPKWYVLDGHSRLSGEPTPSWWSPQRDGETLFFACSQTLGGCKDDRFRVVFEFPILPQGQP